MVHLLSEEILQLLALPVQLSELVPAQVVELAYTPNTFYPFLSEHLLQGSGVFSHTLVIVVGFIKRPLHGLPLRLKFRAEVLKFAVFASEFLLLLLEFIFLELLLLREAVELFLQLLLLPMPLALRIPEFLFRLSLDF